MDSNKEQMQTTASYEQVSRALSRDYFRIFHVDLKNCSYVEYIPHPEDQKLDSQHSGDDFFRDLREIFLSMIYREDTDFIFTALTREHIRRALSEDEHFTLNFRLVLDGKANHVRLKATRLYENDPDRIIIGLSNIDASMHRLAEYEKMREQNLTYASISEALASDYFCIYYVDTLTESFEVYNASETYRSLGLKMKGEDFFEDGTAFSRLVCDEDLDIFRMAFSKANVIKILKSERSFSQIFRVVLNGEYVHIQMKATRMEAEDNHHIVVGLSNVEARVRQEKEYAQALGAANEAANRDPLTGVKSKHAFSVAEKEIDDKIAQGAVENVSVVVCDVNGLKQINDTLGHKAGDAYIREASMLICDIFKRSPVYRIGGDEFVVILGDRDFESRAELLSKLDQQVLLHKQTGGVVIATGMSDVDCAAGESFGDAFERADAAMYQKKKALKTSGK